MVQLFKLAFLAMLYISQNSRAKIMRNNALMSKMVSHFQGKDNNLSIEPAPMEASQPAHVLSLMQNVLCRNFPSIPCEVITQDETLKKLIQKSIQQIKYKKLTMDKSTPSPGYHLTLFPVLNSEDLSTFLQASETGYFDQKQKQNPQTPKKSVNVKNFWSHEELPHQSKKESKRTTVYNGRKKIRKFYPHKIKYKDKNNVKKDFGEYSQEKLSMSVELPDTNMGRRRQRLSYKVEPSDLPPVWRIDYMKHGEPSLNMFEYETDSLKGKIMKTGPNVIVDENVLEQAARRDVLHPDVYIKNNYVRKRNEDINSDGID